MSDLISLNEMQVGVIGSDPYVKSIFIDDKKIVQVDFENTLRNHQRLEQPK